VRVLVVTTVHVPLDARIHHRQIRSLRAAGCEVTYAAPWTATGANPAAVAPGTVVRDLPRAVGRRRWLALRAARRLVAAEGPRHDLVLLHDPELVLAVVGRRRRLPPIVLDVHEDLVGSLPDRSWVPRPARGVAARLGARLERWAEDHLALLLAEEGYRQRFAAPHPVVPNLPWLPPEPSAPGTHRRVVYVGRLSRGRGAAELTVIGRRLRERDGPVLELAGPADADVEPALRAAHARGDLRWHGFQPNERAMALVAGSVAGLSLLHDLPNYRSSMPTKVVEYLAHGVPAITTPLPRAAALVRGADAGIVVPQDDVDAVVAAIEQLDGDPSLRARFGANGRRHVAASASWDVVADRFVATLAAIAAGGSGMEHGNGEGERDG
jgi:glycosyltransferase involved in cell wall biosynthesis